MYLPGGVVGKDRAIWLAILAVPTRVAFIRPSTADHTAQEESQCILYANCENPVGPHSPRLASYLPRTSSSIARSWHGRSRGANSSHQFSLSRALRVVPVPI